LLPNSYLVHSRNKPNIICLMRCYSLKYVVTLTSFFIFFLLVCSCSENADPSDGAIKERTKDNSKGNIYPNGSSELALLMRAMYDESEIIKQQVDKGEPVKLTLDYSKILSAHATDPKTAASGDFKSYSNVYLQIMNSLESSNPEEAKTHYENMVNSCINCHQAMCPGPIVKIKKLL
jgi:hypothetical protein